VNSRLPDFGIDESSDQAGTTSSRASAPLVWYESAPPDREFPDEGFQNPQRKVVTSTYEANCPIAVVAADERVCPQGWRSRDCGTCSAYLGFDRNDYPGDGKLTLLRQTFSFAGFGSTILRGRK
jgi:hypothetical protein